ncbi:hypothetical protein B296_00033287 [Ensete ventricosum]|uniref:Uncharacterized protein n=1 Tax=Ensete ventricosum TaxID=4639 RepID=A0A426Z108_ENSVE|nr:hypothetical protein B296_00033287 [Ensete ventricosum]
MNLIYGVKVQKTLRDATFGGYFGFVSIVSLLVKAKVEDYKMGNGEPVYVRSEGAEFESIFLVLVSNQSPLRDRFASFFSGLLSQVLFAFSPLVDGSCRPDNGVSSFARNDHLVAPLKTTRPNANKPQAWES